MIGKGVNLSIFFSLLFLILHESIFKVVELKTNHFFFRNLEIRDSEWRTERKECLDGNRTVFTKCISPIPATRIILWWNKSYASQKWSKRKQKSIRHQIKKVLWEKIVCLHFDHVSTCSKTVLLAARCKNVPTLLTRT